MLYNFTVKKRKKVKLFKTLVAGIAIVFVWRGIWGLLDIFLFPQNPVLSYVFSALFGLTILYIDDFSLDELVRKD